MLIKKESKFDIEQFFIDNKKKKECFDEILLLRKKIDELEIKYNIIQDNEMASFKKKNEFFKQMKNNSFQYDLIYACLFGNNIIV